jgi:hypothetical protein
MCNNNSETNRHLTLDKTSLLEQSLTPDVRVQNDGEVVGAMEGSLSQMEVVELNEPEVVLPDRQGRVLRLRRRWRNVTESKMSTHRKHYADNRDVIVRRSVVFLYT